MSMLYLSKQLPLKLVPIESPRDHRPVAIMTLKNRTLSSLTQHFIDCADETVRQFRT